MKLRLLLAENFGFDADMLRLVAAWLRLRRIRRRRIRPGVHRPSYVTTLDAWEYMGMQNVRPTVDAAGMQNVAMDTMRRWREAEQCAQADADAADELAQSLFK